MVSLVVLVHVSTLFLAQRIMVLPERHFLLNRQWYTALRSLWSAGK